MNILFIILAVFIVIAAVLLIIVVLLQNGKGANMASNFVAGNQTLGVRQTADLLEKITWGLVAFILVLSVASTFTLGSRGGADSTITDRIENATTTEQPTFPTAPIQQEAPTTEATPGE